jgi:hypothetical protein
MVHMIAGRIAFQNIDLTAAGRVGCADRALFR